MLTTQTFGGSLVLDDVDLRTAATRGAIGGGRVKMMGLVACEACGTEISVAAVACPKCGHPTSVGVEASRPSDVAAVVMLLTPIVGAMLIHFWVGSMRMIDNPMQSFQLVVVAVVAITAIMAAADAAALGRAISGGMIKNNPATWLAFVLLVWPIGFPAYLSMRSRSGGRSYGFVAVIVVLLFLVAAGWYGNAINDATAETQRRLDLLRQKWGN